MRKVSAPRVSRLVNAPTRRLQSLRGRMLSRLGGHLCRYCGSNSGAAAVEFSLLVPVLATIVLGISQVSTILVGSSDMETASRAAIQYVLNGGSDMSVADDAGMLAWDNKPANATLASNEYCTCDGVTASCTQACPDGRAPYQYVSVTTTGYLGGSLFHLNRSETQTVRVR